jgi:hypothetical protein
MPTVYSQPAKVAIVSMSVSSSSGQEVLKLVRQLGLDCCSMIDLRSLFPMPEDELAVIASPNHGSPEQHIAIMRLVHRHDAFVGTVNACVESSVDGTQNQAPQLYIRIDEEGGLADVVCRAEVEVLQQVEIEEDGVMMPAFDVVYQALSPKLSPTIVGTTLSRIVAWLGSNDDDHRPNVPPLRSYATAIGLDKDYGPGQSNEEVESWNATSVACRGNRASLADVVAHTEFYVTGNRGRENPFEPKRIRCIGRRVSHTIPRSMPDATTIGDWIRSVQRSGSGDAERLGVANLYMDEHRGPLVEHPNNPEVTVSYEHHRPLHSTLAGQPLPSGPSSLPGPHVIRPSAPEVIEASSVSGERPRVWAEGSEGLPVGRTSILDSSLDSRASESTCKAASSDCRLAVVDPRANDAGKGKSKAGKGKDKPDSRTSDQWAAYSRTSDQWGSWQGQPSENWSWSSSPPSSTQPWKNQPVQRDHRQPQANEHRRQLPHFEYPCYEPWICCAHGHRAPDVEMWSDYLRNYLQVDQSAFARLVCLSQMSPAGYREANKLVDKMITKVDTGKAHELLNSSAYVISGVTKARKLLTPEGEYYVGCGPSLR